MKIFKRQKPNAQKLPPFIRRQLLRMDNKLYVLAAWLQQKTNGFSFKRIKILLVGFCFIFLSVSVIVIYQGLKFNDSNIYIISTIRTIPLLKETGRRPIINEQELKRIHAFKIFLDSLQTTANGKLQIDSILSGSPHLIDTINYLENIYYEQQTNRK
jgi:hypothetical protein